MGIQQTVLNNLINQKYLNILSEDLGIKVEDKYIKKSILNNPIFKFIEKIGRNEQKLIM